MRTRAIDFHSVVVPDRKILAGLLVLQYAATRSKLGKTMFTHDLRPDKLPARRRYDDGVVFRVEPGCSLELCNRTVGVFFGIAEVQLLLVEGVKDCRHAGCGVAVVAVMDCESCYGAVNFAEVFCVVRAVGYAKAAPKHVPRLECVNCRVL